MEVMDLGDVVMKMVGPVYAVGDSHADEKRLENLKVLTELVERLLLVIKTASNAADRPEASMKKIGMYAGSFLQGVRHYGDSSRG